MYGNLGLFCINVGESRALLQACRALLQHDPTYADSDRYESGRRGGTPRRTTSPLRDSHVSNQHFPVHVYVGVCVCVCVRKCPWQCVCVCGCCNVLQCVAVCCSSTPRRTISPPPRLTRCNLTLSWIYMHIKVCVCVGVCMYLFMRAHVCVCACVCACVCVHCIVLQCVAVCCSGTCCRNISPRHESPSHRFSSKQQVLIHINIYAYAHAHTQSPGGEVFLNSYKYTSSPWEVL